MEVMAGNMHHLCRLVPPGWTADVLVLDALCPRASCDAQQWFPDWGGCCASRELYCLSKKASCSIQKDFHCEFLKFSQKFSGFCFCLIFACLFSLYGLFLLFFLFFLRKKIKTTIMLLFFFSPQLLSYADRFPSKSHLLDLLFYLLTKCGRPK